ncbi:phospholipase A2 'basic'-like [Physella acuta]|uniref:phospholipase A2 'basic'-like n=1 Tax=Physella acuta TaxID=109671 RepID=UPI0027DAD4B8|nr:phospholipase A2 'basic'-like [Physella acuta]
MRERNSLCFVYTAPSEVIIHKRSIFNLAGLLTQATGRDGAIYYNGYGCFCGLGGYGTPVDDTDRCCKAHDDCYGTIMDCWPYVVDYKYSCSGNNCTCAPSNTFCGQKSCKCDLDFANCAARSKYNAIYWNYDKKNKC